MTRSGTMSIVASMEIIVTFSDDVAESIRQAALASGKTPEEFVLESVRTALAGQGSTRLPRFVVEAKPMGLLPGIDPAGFNKLLDELDVEEYLRKRDGTPES
ncbi:MAG: hypothetical protein SGI88_06965 [Candidatus Hydrogenedentes bacterium]|nr:hypothetical protein [Candidatus Hydrogenedentota bacterium]